MQLGPATPDNTIQDPPADESVSIQPPADENPADQHVQLGADTTEPAQPVLSEQDLQESSSNETFFESMLNGQEMPTSSTMLMVAGVVLAFLVIMRSLMRSSAKRKQQTRSMGDTSERIETIREHARGSVDPARQAMVDAEDLTRRMGAVLDNKATKIEILLEEATERIAQLERANRDLRVQQSIAPTPQPTVDPATRSHQPSASESPADQSTDQPGVTSHPEVQQSQQSEQRGMPPEMLDRARLDQDRADRTWVEPNASDSDQSHEEPIFRIDRGLTATPRAESPHPLTFPEQVDELATQGYNALEIADKLNRLVGEVELVLNLRRNSG